MLRNKLLMLLIILLLSFAWLSIELATWLMTLMARGALSVARGNIYLFQIDMRLADAKKPIPLRDRLRIDGAFRQIMSFLKVRQQSK